MPPIASHPLPSTRPAVRGHHQTATSRSSSHRPLLRAPEGRQLGSRCNTPKNKKAKMQITIRSRDRKISSRSKMLAQTKQKETRKRAKTSRITNFNRRTTKAKTIKMPISRRKEQLATNQPELATTIQAIRKFHPTSKTLFRCRAHIWLVARLAYIWVMLKATNHLS